MSTPRDLDEKSAVAALEYARAAQKYLARKYRLSEDDVLWEGLLAEAALAFLHRAEVAGVAHPQTYVRNTVRNLLFKRMGRRNRIREIPLPPEHALPEDLIVRAAEEPDSGQETSVAPRKETPLAQPIREFLAKLPPAPRAVAEARVIDSLSRNDIAQKLGLAPATVRQYCIRAAERLHAIDFPYLEVKEAILKVICPEWNRPAA